MAVLAYCKLNRSVVARRIAGVALFTTAAFGLADGVGPCLRNRTVSLLMNAVDGAPGLAAALRNTAKSSVGQSFTLPSGAASSPENARAQQRTFQRPLPRRPWSGRTLFDFVDGWGGRHTLDVPLVVVTHRVPTDLIRGAVDGPNQLSSDSA